MSKLKKAVKYEVGDIVRLATKNDIMSKTEDFIYNAVVDENSEYVLFEKFDIENFPSWNDYQGKCYRIKAGTSGIIVESITGTSNIYNPKDKAWEEIYTCKIFIQNVIIETINTIIVKV
ncbi:MAG: hypothetical protein ACW98X_21955 [Promethearchaeota archaeon]|jgi:hypothetical protein